MLCKMKCAALASRSLFYRFLKREGLWYWREHDNFVIKTYGLVEHYYLVFFPINIQLLIQPFRNGKPLPLFLHVKKPLTTSSIQFVLHIITSQTWKAILNNASVLDKTTLEVSLASPLTFLYSLTCFLHRQNQINLN